MANIMLSSLAGNWYPSDPDELRTELRSFMPALACDDDLAGLIAPHAGYRFSGRVAGAAYARVNPRRYNRVLILAPAHYEPLRDVFSLPNAEGIQTPLGVARFDEEACGVLRASPFHRVIPSHREEHSHQIQVPFLQVIFGEELRLVPVLVGRVSPEKRGAIVEELRKIVTPHTLLVISTDFTHYGSRFGYRPFAVSVADRIRALDESIYDALAGRDAAKLEAGLLETKATVCGREALLLFSALLPPSACFEKTDYETSGNLLGDYTDSVSYLSAVVHATPENSAGSLSAEEKKELLAFARRTLESAAAHGKAREEPARITPGMAEKRGAFVTLRSGDHVLRGCIGEIQPERPLWKVVRDRTRSAALEDPRFQPVAPHEAPDLKIEISALTPPSAIDSPSEIIVGRHGVILSKGSRGAVFLPQVATEEKWSREEMLNRLACKAGLDSAAWRSPDARFEVFEAEVFREE